MAGGRRGPPHIHQTDAHFARPASEMAIRIRRLAEKSRRIERGQPAWLVAAHPPRVYGTSARGSRADAGRRRRPAAMNVPPGLGGARVVKPASAAARRCAHTNFPPRTNFVGACWSHGACGNPPVPPTYPVGSCSPPLSPTELYEPRERSATHRTHAQTRPSHIVMPPVHFSRVTIAIRPRAGPPLAITQSIPGCRARAHFAHRHTRAATLVITHATPPARRRQPTKPCSPRSSSRSPRRPRRRRRRRRRR